MYAEVSAASSAWPWIPVVAAISGVVLGWILTRIPARHEHRRKAAGYFRGIDAEIDYAAKHARIYVDGENGTRVVAPAYRLLTRFSIDGTAWLAGEGFITKDEIEALLAYVAAAEEFNRCLEEAAAVAANTTALNKLERATPVTRANVKARNLYDGEPAKGVAVTAQTAIRAAAARAGLKLAD